MGLEPTKSLDPRFLRPMRLPFRHRPRFTLINRSGVVLLFNAQVSQSQKHPQVFQVLWATGCALHYNEVVQAGKVRRNAADLFLYPVLLHLFEANAGDERMDVRFQDILTDQQPLR